MQAQQLTVAVERLNGDIRSITEQISGSESRIAVLENDIRRNEESLSLIHISLPRPCTKAWTLRATAPWG